MVLIIFDLTEDIKKENTHIPLEILMVKEELGEKAEVLTVDWVLRSIDFEHGHLLLFVPVYLISRRMEKRAIFAMTLDFLLESEETETKLTEIQAVDIMVVNGIWAIVPCLRLVFADLNPVDGFEFSGLLMRNQSSMVHSVVLRVVIFLSFLGLLVPLLLGVLVDYFLA